MFHSPIETLYFIIVNSSKNGVWRSVEVSMHFKVYSYGVLETKFQVVKAMLLNFLISVKLLPNLVRSKQRKENHHPSKVMRSEWSNALPYTLSWGEVPVSEDGKPHGLCLDQQLWVQKS